MAIYIFFVSLQQRCPLKLDEHCRLNPPFCIKEGESKMVATHTSPSRAGCLVCNAINFELGINFELRIKFELTINFEFGMHFEFGINHRLC